jgi:hemerythrin-like domain-containing protein
MKDLLISDHLELDSLVAELFSALDKGDTADVYRKLDFFWARLAMHIRAEHLHLFPAILKTARKGQQPQPAPNGLIPSVEDVENSIRNLQNDHNFFMRELGEAVKQMFEMRENNWQDETAKIRALREKIAALCERLKKHNELEESGIYLWAEIFTPAEMATLQSKIQKELENLPPRFVRAA